MKKLTAIILGYGMRGSTYARFAVDNPELLEIKAVAEPEISRREKAQKLHNIPDSLAVDTWEKLCELPKMADFAIISTQDNMHYAPALQLIEKGYNLLLEKPMAPNAKECKEIAEAAERKGVKVIVCHVLRFTNFWYTLKNILDSGKIGTPMTVIHTEGVERMHQSHSFVRGNWRNSVESSPMILAKSCHDTDILQWLIGKPCKKVQSFGGRDYFKAENRPEGAPDRCLDNCPHKDTCKYEPIRFYTEMKDNPWRDVVADRVDATNEEIIEALHKGPYGRCVFACDNDVVDHQTVNMEFEGGCTVVFTMTAFTEGRTIRVLGTNGEIDANMTDNTIKVFDFITNTTETYDLDKIGETISAGHGGGDTGIMIDLVKYFTGEETSKSICSIRTSYLNHLIAFAAEESRLTDTVIDLEKFSDSI